MNILEGVILISLLGSAIEKLYLVENLQIAE